MLPKVIEITVNPISYFLLLVFRTRLWGTAVSGTEQQLSTEIIIVFPGSFTGDATCNLDFPWSRTTGRRVQVLLKGISCTGWEQELPWHCKVSPLMFSKGTLLSQSFRSAAWEASRMTRKQICKFFSFGVAHFHTSCTCVRGKDMPVGHTRLCDVTQPEEWRAALLPWGSTAIGRGSPSDLQGHHAAWGLTC